jgi:hypothetical protein
MTPQTVPTALRDYARIDCQNTYFLAVRNSNGQIDYYSGPHSLSEQQIFSMFDRERFLQLQGKPASATDSPVLAVIDFNLPQGRAVRKHTITVTTTMSLSICAAVWIWEALSLTANGRDPRDAGNAACCSTQMTMRL